MWYCLTVGKKQLTFKTIPPMSEPIKIELEDVVLSKEEQLMFRRLMRRSQLDTFPDFIFRCLGPENGLLFFELFAGDTIEVPNMEDTKKAVLDAKIMTYWAREQVAGRNGYESLSTWLGIKISDAIRRIGAIQAKIGEFNKKDFEKAVQMERKRKRDAKNLRKKNERVYQSMLNNTKQEHSENEDETEEKTPDQFQTQNETQSKTFKQLGLWE